MPRFLALAPILAALLFACSSGADVPSVRVQSIGKTEVTPTSAPIASPSPTSTFLKPEELAPLTLGKIFPPRDLVALPVDTSRLRTLVATGDIIPARMTDVVIRRQGDDFLYPVARTTELTSAADITVANLEAPLMQACPYHDSGFTFCGRPGFTQALKAAGVDVATLENNHISNYGPQGVSETVQHLEAAGIAAVDRQTPAIVDVRGLKFGFLAFNGVGEDIDRLAMVEAVEALRQEADLVVVAFHWGAEYVSVPEISPGVANDNPMEIAHMAIDAGADLIVGNHPHWVQGVEVYKGKFIAYAHGNFIFDQMWSYETRVGVVGRYTFYDRTLVKVEFTPTLINNYAQPIPLQGAEAQAVLDAMKAASEQIEQIAAH